jgi:hypothetical protein
VNHPILKPTHIPPPRGWARVSATWHYYDRSVFASCNANAYNGTLQERPGDSAICEVCARRAATNGATHE